jgi:transaldolase / glucose-6-phosphate isomerase
VWTGSGESKWLGWLDEPVRMREDVDIMRVFADELDGEFDAIVLLGMGGSSLAPEVLRRSFRVENFHVLDTTHPQAIRELEAKLDLSRTLFIAASKSGSTLETRSHADHFWSKTKNSEQWVAITDPGSALDELARKRNFRGIFPGEPTIGGRYSALSPFGMVPAALMNVDLIRLLDRTDEMVEACRLAEGNPGLDLGLSLGEGWHEGRDKICMPNQDGFGLWAEQLVAESTGKLGKGLIPAPGESPDGLDRQAQEVRLPDPYELGQEFFRWEFGTAVAGSILGINPFDQPDVQAAKDRTNEVLAAGDVELEDESSVEELLAQANEGDYVCIQAFVNPTPTAVEKIGLLADQARAQTGCVITHGLGPRYLHSTGQLHKGGPNTGLFIQIVEDYGKELGIPGQKFGFARLIRAQAAGDFGSLKERGRRVARVHLENL